MNTITAALIGRAHALVCSFPFRWGGSPSTKYAYLSEDNCAAELTTTRTVQMEVWEDGADIRADMGTNVCLNPWHSLSLVLLTAPSVAVGAAEH